MVLESVNERRASTFSDDSMTYSVLGIYIGQKSSLLSVITSLLFILLLKDMCHLTAIKPLLVLTF